MIPGASALPVRLDVPQRKTAGWDAGVEILEYDALEDCARKALRPTDGASAAHFPSTFGFIERMIQISAAFTPELACHLCAFVVLSQLP
jgi:hypothetical protein